MKQVYNMENLVYPFFRQLWLVLGVKLMEINSKLGKNRIEMKIDISFDRTGVAWRIPTISPFFEKATGPVFRANAFRAALTSIPPRPTAHALLQAPSVEKGFRGPATEIQFPMPQ